MNFLKSELGSIRHQIKEVEDNGFDTMSFNFELGFVCKIYVFCIIGLFTIAGIWEEVTGNNTTLNKLFKAQLGHKDLHRYLARESILQDMPHDDEIPECDYTTMTPKRFFNDYVKKNRPCLFKGYGKRQKAYQLWRNESYLIE